MYHIAAMDELAYRDTYHAINERRCWFEKALNARACDCRLKRRFHLADREGVACTDADAHRTCEAWLERLRREARLALAQSATPAILPHRLEAKVQAGGMRGLAELLEEPDEKPDVSALLARAADRCGGLARIPLAGVAAAVAAYEPRRRPARKRP